MLESFSMVVNFSRKNRGVGLLLVILLTGCDVAVPDDQYQLGPDSQIQPGVPQGEIREITLRPSTGLPGLFA